LSSGEFYKRTKGTSEKSSEMQHRVEKEAIWAERIERHDLKPINDLTMKVRKTAAAASFGARALNAFTKGAQITNPAAIGKGIIMKGISFWVKQQEINRLRMGLCYDFFTRFDFEKQLLYVWDRVITPPMEEEARDCSEDDDDNSKECDATWTEIAENWILYAETFLAVLTHLTQHQESCDRNIDAIQRSWNDLAKGVEQARPGREEWVWEFHWSDGAYHVARNERGIARRKQIEPSRKRMEKQLRRHTPFFSSDSSVERIIGVAKRLGIYNERTGESEFSEALKGAGRRS
jgi:hypothetical protein